ncbi:hypothetical protein BC938DRAFT_483513 [Jimgerdemannia flammicorona]|uniref:Uncharacterized protein n=1 Tax=Jimgerdemannia flammicorona TaxID=994334 RepID=A0A433QBW2_9FUNG|nr:hypothetical protein BC938DRAFT_483513 [Jimgerdemannia flammicorona]
MSKRSRASGTSATSLIHDSISLKGPLKDVTKARDAVEALLDSIDVQQVDVVYPIAQEILAFRRFKSLAGSIRTRRNVVMEYFRKSATSDNVTIHIVASGGAGVVQKTLEKLAAVRFCSETFKIPEGQHYPVGKQSKPFKRLILNDFNVFLNFRPRLWRHCSRGC